MQTVAVVLNEPGSLALRRLSLVPPGDADVVVDVEWSGISTGTEKLLWSGRMPPFPGLGYPLVPGYEAVGRVSQVGRDAGAREGAMVFVPGARCFGEVRGLFGGSASRLVVPGAKLVPIDEELGSNGVLMALAATARHALAGGEPPELIVGHGVLGRLIARIACLMGPPPTVWETHPARVDGAVGYKVIDAAIDERRDYSRIMDVSGDASLLDALIARLRPGGEICLAGFYAEPLQFAFPPAFMREARLRIAAEWKQPDLDAVLQLVADGSLSLDGLISHHAPADDAAMAYETAFQDPGCLKMILDWRMCA